MKNGNMIAKLILGIMGACYVVLATVFLGIAIHEAGDIRFIFTLPVNELAFAMLGTFFGAAGLILLLVMLVLILISRKQKRLREELLQYGTRVKGTIINVRADYSIKVNSRSPLIAKVQCSFPTGEVTLKSHRLWNIRPSVGDTVDVLYDPMDERKYVIDFQEK